MRTVNRQPFSIAELTDDDVKYRYFNYSQWKGMCDDKNYIGVDQETFEDCNNIYVDEDGVLRSRPAIKLLATPQGLRDIVNVWNFDIIQAYQTKHNGENHLYFAKDNVVTNIPLNVPERFVLVLADEKIFLFAKNRIAYLDIKTSDWNNEILDWYDSDSTDEQNATTARSKIYVPILNADTSSVSTEIDSPNELTTGSLTQYIYENVDNIDTLKFIGKQVTIKIGNQTFEVEFTSNTQLVLVESVYSTDRNDIYSTGALGINDENIPLIEVHSDVNKNIVLLSYSKRHNNVFEYKLYTSVDFITFNYFDTVSDALHKPLLSKDGTFIVVFKNDGPYAKSILATTNYGLEFVDWTSLLHGMSTTGIQYNYEENISINENNQLNVLIGAVFNNSSEFAFMYGIDPIHVENSQQPVDSYLNIKLIKYKSTFITKVLKSSANALEFLNGQTMIDVSKVTSTSPLDTTIDFNLTSTIYDESHKYSATFISEQNTFYYKHSNEIFNGMLGNIAGQLTIDNHVYNVNKDIRVSIESLPTVINDSVQILVPVKLSNDVDFNVDFNAEISVIITRSSPTSCTAEYNTVKLLLSYTSDIVSSGEIFSTQAILTEMQNSDVYAWISMMEYQVNSEPTIFKRLMKISDIVSEYSTTKYRRISLRNPLRDSISFDDLNVYVFYSLDSSSELSKLKVSKFSTEINNDVISESAPLYTLTENEIIKAYADDYILTSKVLFHNDVSVDLLIGDNNIPLFVAPNKIAYIDKAIDLNTIYTNLRRNKVTILTGEIGALTIPDIDFVSKLQNHYFVIGNKLMISTIGANQDVDDFKWYFPKINSQTFDYQITAIHPISTSEMALFFEHAIYYTGHIEQGYTYSKSRIPLGCKYGTDIITSYDGKYTIFATQRGLVAMSYQDFVSSTEQALTYLSDNIFSKFNKWNTEAVKLTQHKFWLIVYNVNSLDAFVFDMRTSSWWPVSVKSKMNKVFVINNTLQLLNNGHISSLDTSDENYKDDAGLIEWRLMSQKLHFNAVNYYKHVMNITFNALSDSDDETTFNADFVNYSTHVLLGKKKSITYNIDLIGTFIKRLNYQKVNEFQFLLTSDNNLQPIPLSLTNISIKYKITGQVR